MLSSCRTNRAAARSNPRSTAASERKPASFSASETKRRHSRPAPSPTCTTLSRPNTAPISAAVSTAASGRSGASARILPRPPCAPSKASNSSAIFPARTEARTFSNPATARPARRARPIPSQQRWASTLSIRPASSAGTDIGRRAAREKSLFAAARSKILRHGVSHRPLPGRSPATSGTSSPPGPTTNRNRPERSLISPVAMQRRSGPTVSSSLPGRIAEPLSLPPVVPTPVPVS